MAHQTERESALAGSDTEFDRVDVSDFQDDGGDDDLGQGAEGRDLGDVRAPDITRDRDRDRDSSRDRSRSSGGGGGGDGGRSSRRAPGGSAGFLAPGVRAGGEPEPEPADPETPESRAVSRTVRQDPDVAGFDPQSDIQRLGPGALAATVGTDAGGTERRVFTFTDRGERVAFRARRRQRGRRRRRLMDEIERARREPRPGTVDRRAADALADLGSLRAPMTAPEPRQGPGPRPLGLQLGAEEPTAPGPAQGAATAREPAVAGPMAGTREIGPAGGQTIDFGAFDVTGRFDLGSDVPGAAFGAREGFERERLGEEQVEFGFEDTLESEARAFAGFAERTTAPIPGPAGQAARGGLEVVNPAGIALTGVRTAETGAFLATGPGSASERIESAAGQAGVTGLETAEFAGEQPFRFGGALAVGVGGGFAAGRAIESVPRAARAARLRARGDPTFEFEELSQPPARTMGDLPAFTERAQRSPRAARAEFERQAARGGLSEDIGESTVFHARSAEDIQEFGGFGRDFEVPEAGARPKDPTGMAVSADLSPLRLPVESGPSGRFRIGLPRPRIRGSRILAERDPDIGIMRGETIPEARQFMATADPQGTFVRSRGIMSPEQEAFVPEGARFQAGGGLFGVRAGRELVTGRIMRRAEGDAPEGIAAGEAIEESGEAIASLRRRQRRAEEVEPFGPAPVSTTTRRPSDAEDVLTLDSEDIFETPRTTRTTRRGPTATRGPTVGTTTGVSAPTSPVSAPTTPPSVTGLTTPSGPSAPTGPTGPPTAPTGPPSPPTTPTAPPSPPTGPPSTPGVPTPPAAPPSGPPTGPPTEPPTQPPPLPPEEFELEPPEPSRQRRATGFEEIQFVNPVAGLAIGGDLAIEGFGGGPGFVGPVTGGGSLFGGGRKRRKRKDDDLDFLDGLELDI